MDTVYETPKQSIARQLREVRKAEGMTQQHLAELVGTKKSNISRFESGKYNPSVEFLMKLADGIRLNGLILEIEFCYHLVLLYKSFLCL